MEERDLPIVINRLHHNDFRWMCADEESAARGKDNLLFENLIFTQGYVLFVDDVHMIDVLLKHLLVRVSFFKTSW